MDFYEVLNKRKTIRDFKEDLIPDNVIERIIRSAFKAPTNDHMRNWHFIIINDLNTVKKFVEKLWKKV